MKKKEKQNSTHQHSCSHYTVRQTKPGCIVQKIETLDDAERERKREAWKNRKRFDL